MSAFHALLRCGRCNVRTRTPSLRRSRRTTSPVTGTSRRFPFTPADPYRVRRLIRQMIYRERTDVNVPDGGRFLAGKVAVVTGSGGAMGGAVAVRLARAGAHIVLNDRVADRVDVHRQAVESHRVETVTVVASTSRTDGADAVVAAALEAWGRLDVLVNVVGGIKGPIEIPVWEITDEQWDATVAISLTSAFRCTRAAAPTMIAARSGKIVNIAS